jgi:hypothetical protein
MLNGILCTLPRDPAEHTAETYLRRQTGKLEEDLLKNNEDLNEASIFAQILSRLNQWKPFD